MRALVQGIGAGIGFSVVTGLTALAVVWANARSYDAARARAMATVGRSFQMLGSGDL